MFVHTSPLGPLFLVTLLMDMLFSMLFLQPSEEKRIFLLVIEIGSAAPVQFAEWQMGRYVRGIWEEKI